MSKNQIPDYVQDRLSWLLAHEHEDYERHGAAILAISEHWEF
jgi:hypothetical protein